MSNRSKAIFAVTFFMAFIGTVLFLSGMSAGGELEPPGSAFDEQTGKPASTMHSIKDTYDLMMSFPLPTGFVLWDDNPRFAVWDHNTEGDTSDDVVLDTWYNLMWVRDAGISWIGNWNAAVSYCDNLVHGNRTDWRLPTVTDLRKLTLPYPSSTSPALPDGHPFINVQLYWYWSSTEYNSSWAYYMDMKWGFSGLYIDKGYWFNIWPVRDAY